MADCSLRYLPITVGSTAGLSKYRVLEGGNPIDVTDATVALKVTDPDSGDTVIDSPGSVVDVLELEILADTSVTLASDQTASITVGGAQLEAINLGTWITGPTYNSTTCIDLPLRGHALAVWAP